MGSKFYSIISEFSSLKSELPSFFSEIWSILGKSSKDLKINLSYWLARDYYPLYSTSIIQA